MTLVKYNPFRPVSFNQIFDDFAGRSLSDFMKSDFVNLRPSVNVIENDDSFDIEVAAPGLSREDFNVEIEKDRLIISVSKESKTLSEGDYARREFNYSSFTRNFHLPDYVSKEDVTAKYEDGILRIHLVKTPESRDVKKTIEIL